MIGGHAGAFGKSTLFAILLVQIPMKNRATLLTLVPIALATLFSCQKKVSGGPPPVIFSISPDSGHFSTVLTISGANFDTLHSIVTIDSVPAAIRQITDSTITVTIPTTHKGPVVVTTSSGSAKGPVFNYLNDILVAGGQNTAWGVPISAYYWDNGVPVYLNTFIRQSNCFTTGIAASGNDIYVCGYIYYGMNTMAEVWVDGVEQTLTSTTQNARANAIFVSGQDVYVAGNISNGTHDVATVWRNGNPIAMGDGMVDSYATAITLAGNDIYIAGYKGQPGNANHVAVSWKNGTVSTLSDGTADTYATGIAVTGNNVYVTGYIQGSSALLWKDGAASPLGGNFATGAFTNNNEVYVAGYSSGIYGYASYVWTWGPGYPGYSLGSVAVSALTADSSGVYTANSPVYPGNPGISYSICTGIGSVTTIPLNLESAQGSGIVSAICIRH